MPLVRRFEHLGGEQRRQADRARRADDDFGEAFALDVIEHLHDGREAELLQFVLRQLEFADRLKVLDRNVVDAELAARRDNDEILARGALQPRSFCGWWWRHR